MRALILAGLSIALYSALFSRAVGPLILFSITVMILNDQIGRSSNDFSRKLLSVVAIFLVLTLLILEKTGILGFSIPGISFFSFSSISLLVDQWRHAKDRILRPGEAFAFILYFPKLLSGPLARASVFASELRRPTQLTAVSVDLAFTRIVFGIVKKFLIADFLGAQLVAPVFSPDFTGGALETLIGLYAFAIQIYLDFSGFIDIAIGISIFFGITLPENFAEPYRASSIRDFWRRWHITLSEWIRDYLFIPLGGNQGTKAIVVTRLLITMILCGLWHGSSWPFVLWGLYHGMLLGVEHWRNKEFAPESRLRSKLLTFHLVLLGWLFFRSSDLTEVLRIFKNLSHGFTMSAQYLSNHSTELTVLTLAYVFHFSESWMLKKIANYSLALKILIYSLLVIWALGTGFSSAQFIYLGF